MQSNELASKTQVGGDHYLSKAIQPWDAMEAWFTPEQFQGFLQGNAIKYLARWRDKGGVEDLRKARHYLDKLIEVVDEPRKPAPELRETSVPQYPTGYVPRREALTE